jgi:hypothetical protein
MRIKWGNIFALAILICLVILLLRLPEVMNRLSYTIWIPYYINDPVFGILVFGLICITVVAVVKILSRR